MEPDPTSGYAPDPVPPPPDLGHDPPAMLLLVDDAGLRVLGAPTVDSDHDGVADTVLVPGSGDDVLGLATDLDGDGVVDVVTTVHTDGTATTIHPGQDDPGGWASDDRGVGHRPGAPTLDPDTGVWTRML